MFSFNYVYKLIKWECQVKKEFKSAWVEQWALQNKIEMFYYDIKCVETKMFNNINT